MKRYFTILFLFILYTCVGCASNFNSLQPRTIRSNSIEKIIYIDSKFNDEQTNRIVAALNAWECSTSGMVKFIINIYDFSYSIDPHKSLVIIKANKDNDDIIEADRGLNKEFEKDPGDGKTRKVVGLYLGPAHGEYEKILLVGDRITLEDYKPLTLHETGHALHLDHIEDKDSIMYRHLDSSSGKLTKNDLKQFCNLYGCDNNELKVCN